MHRFKWAILAASVGAMVGLIYLIGSLPAANAAPGSSPLDDVHFVGFATGLHTPVDIAFTGVVTDTRMFIVEIAGKIMIVQSNGAIVPTPFLDISGLVLTVNEEQGLLGLAFAPDYGASGRFYVYYVNVDGNLQLSRYQVSGNPDVADPTETKLLTIPHPDCRNHNGGDLNFGPDGYLYLAPGDGGGQNDSCQGVPGNENDAQRLNSLLGKVLRLNVTGVDAYTVPDSNPYAHTPGARPEIWAMGLRNPWRFSFDRLTGDMYIGDVGQDQFEEVDFQPHASQGGENYGWRCYEGLQLYQECGTSGPYTFPVFAYDHGVGRAVVGGYVYRGSLYPALDGYYFFADDITGKFWARGGCPRTVTDLDKLLGDTNPTSFGQNAAGELYLSVLSGTIYHLVGPAAPATPEPPAIMTPLFLPQVINFPC